MNTMTILDVRWLHRKPYEVSYSTLQQIFAMAHGCPIFIWFVPCPLPWLCLRWIFDPVQFSRSVEVMTKYCCLCLIYANPPL